DPEKINPHIPTDLVVDHSVQVDYYGTPQACQLNLDKEYQRNIERYKLIKWAQGSFKGMRVVPPGNGIVHQVNLEYLSPVIDIREFRGEKTAVIDTVVGTDSHTPMINGLGVVGWGVGGIEAEAVMLGQPYYLILPEVIGVKFTGELREGVTATDLVLSITEMLRKKGVVGKFVEYFGSGLSNLSVPDRATISNMCPEYGATLGFFPIDEATIAYLRLTGRDPKHIEFIEKYAKAQKIFRTDNTPDPIYTEILELDLSTVESSLSGPRNPEERIGLSGVKDRVNHHIDELIKIRKPPVTDESIVGENGRIKATFEFENKIIELQDGDVVIAAITSCTNTSNPSVMVGAGLLAKKAVEAGLSIKPYVKTSCAPGSRVVTEYLRRLDLEKYLEKLNFHTVGYGCTTCIGNSGPLKQPIAETIQKNDLYVTAILSGNRNFPGRVHALTRGNFLASPLLVIAYALAGTINIDLTRDPLGYNADDKPVYLKDIWPSQKEIREAIEQGVTPDLFKTEYDNILDGDISWQMIDSDASTLFNWNPKSTYIRRPPYFEDFKPGKKPPKDIENARVLVMASEKVSTDHISPAGAITKDSPAGRYLLNQGVEVQDFNTYGSRRGNHEVMVRGTFANVRLRNQLVPDKEGWWTKYHDSGETMPIFDVAMKYKANNIPAIILGSVQYGQGSSRDWAAKGPLLQGVKVVIAKAYERIHRSNLIGMGILPLEFEPKEGWKELKLDGTERFSITGLSHELKPGMTAFVTAHKVDGSKIEFSVKVRLDTPIEIEYYQHGGILHYVVSHLLNN
ncbi:MAG: aconitate hydratase AcnA, partial [Candidatus Hodarchaeota archaeon]